MGALGGNEFGKQKNHVEVKEFKGLQFANRDGFLRLDLDKFESEELFLSIVNRNTDNIQPLSYTLQKATVSEFEFDDYFE